MGNCNGSSKKVEPGPSQKSQNQSYRPVASCCPGQRLQWLRRPLTTVSFLSLQAVAWDRGRVESRQRIPKDLAGPDFRDIHGGRGRSCRLICGIRARGSMLLCFSCTEAARFVQV